MIPNKTARASTTVDRLKSSDGCPVSSNTMKKKVIPDELKADTLVSRT